MSATTLYSDPMTWLVLQQMWFEGPAAIGDVAHERGIELRIIRTDQGEPVPSPDALDAYEGLIVLGGAMGALDDEKHPALIGERALMAAAVERDLPVLGVCLGAQLLAIAGGGELLDGDNGSEDGLGPVELTDDGLSDPVLGPVGRDFEAMHWHEDTYTLPEGAVHLARSDRYEQQAFRLGSCQYGLQFHLEMGSAEVQLLRDDFPDDADLDPARTDEVVVIGRGVFERFFDRAAELAEERAGS